VSTFAVLLGSSYTIYAARGFVGRLPDQAALFSASGERDARFFKECNPATFPQGLAHLGSPSAPPALLVWGDSHAMSILPVLDDCGRKDGVHLVAATNHATAPVLNYVHYDRAGLNEKAIPFGAAILHYVRAESIPNVLLAARWSKYSQDENFKAALLETIDALGAGGTRVFFMKDVPNFEFNVSRVLTKYAWLGRDLRSLTMPRNVYEGTESSYTHLLPEIAQRNAVVLDPARFFTSAADPGTIIPFDSNGSYYFDHAHLSTHGALALRPLFSPLVREIKSSRNAGAGNGAAVNRVDVCGAPALSRNCWHHG